MDTFFAFANLFECSCKLIIVLFTGKTSHVWTQSVVKDSQPSIPGEAPLQFSDQEQTVPSAGLCMWRRGMLTYTHTSWVYIVALNLFMKPGGNNKIIQLSANQIRNIDIMYSWMSVFFSAFLPFAEGVGVLWTQSQILCCWDGQCFRILTLPEYCL